jgi:hypothetical protein
MLMQSLDERVERLEQRVILLEQLPGRVEALELQIVQLRGDVRAEFSATREELRQEIRAGEARILNQAHILHEKSGD